MKKIKKLLSALLILFSIVILNPVQANAAWKQDSTGWWYTEGNSYPQNEWRYINYKWYFFEYSGYLDQNAWMYDGYYLNMNGEWTETAKYLRRDILKNGMAYCKSGDICYEAGNPANLRVINNEPCLYTWNGNEVVKYIGMNTLNVYSYDGYIVDRIVL
ncbi:hypothetical protein [uncultured Clostridium sp.]|uniref:hypothetical protein n=1 Tax=uncultured Clostridium sp. TaxID=59620 RepID=UPI0028E8D2B0|nr:hypothetical protein [uncultured Clostridium sp.]